MVGRCLGCRLRHGEPDDSRLYGALAESIGGQRLKRMRFWIMAVSGVALITLVETVAALVLTGHLTTPAPGWISVAIGVLAAIFLLCGFQGRKQKK